MTPTGHAQNVLTIDLRKLTHSGIGRYLANIVPGVLTSVRADRIQLIGRPEEIASLGPLPPHVSVLPDASTPHSLREQALAFNGRVRQKRGTQRVLWVPHYNIPMLYRGKLVCTIHDTTPLDLQENFGTGKRLLARVLLRRVASTASAILTPSEYSKTRIRALLGVSPERITVTPLAVDSKWPSLAAAPQPYRMPEADHAPYLLFVGNLKPNKNLSTLLQAMTLLGETAPTLLVAGKTEGFRTADDKARSLADQLGDRVRLLGAVTDEELISLYRGAAGFVMPSLYEGFGLPVLEAMRYGCPVLASRVTSLPEVAGDAAILFDPRDAADIAAAIRRALEPDTARQLAQAGMAREANFGYRDAIRVTTEVLQQSLERK